MALNDLINLDSHNLKLGLSEERVEAVIPTVRDYISFWRAYPDMFVDFMVRTCNSNFKFYYYQRLFIRASMRHQYSYFVFPRA